MSILQTIRSCFAVNNRDLASYLNISVDLMQSVSNGRRLWSLTIAEGVNRLCKALDMETSVDKLSGTTDFLNAESLETAGKLKNTIREQQLELVRKQQQLTELLDRRGALLRGLHACENLLKEAPENKWLILRQRNLLLKLKAQPQSKVCLLEARVAALTQSLEVLKC